MILSFTGFLLIQQTAIFQYIILKRSIEEMKRNTVSQFIETIWEIVSDPLCDEIIRWNPHGTSFSILDTEIFEKNIIPRYFNHSNLSSFIRQLNMYNFHKKKTDRIGLEFQHKLFRRGAREILVGIKRKPSEADAREGDELLKEYLERTDSKNDEKIGQQNDAHKEQSNNLTVQVEGNKIAIGEYEGEKKIIPRIIRNVSYLDI